MGYLFSRHTFQIIFYLTTLLLFLNYIKDETIKTTTTAHTRARVYI